MGIIAGVPIEMVIFSGCRCKPSPLPYIIASRAAAAMCANNPLSKATDRPLGASGVAKAKQRHILHVFPSFGIGGMPLRMARIINALGSSFRHSIISLDGAVGAAETVSRDIAHEIACLALPKSSVLKALLLCRAELRRRQPDILVSYNWGSIEWAMSNRLFTGIRHIHHEAGFGKEEISRQLPRRVRFRRWALGRTQRVVVPSRSLERIALEEWRLPRSKVVYVPNGIDVERFAALPGEGDLLISSERPQVIGSLAPLRPEKNVGRLLDAFSQASTSANIELVVAGDGGERKALEQAARLLGIAERVTFLGEVACPERLLRRIDILALSSDTEQMPNAVLEAMASGLPVAAVDVGDVAIMVAPENRPYIVPRGDTSGLAGALVRLAKAPALRTRIGQANRTRVREVYSQERMVSRWREIFTDAAGT